jgi:hypothetical protein
MEHLQVLKLHLRIVVQEYLQAQLQVLKLQFLATRSEERMKLTLGSYKPVKVALIILIISLFSFLVGYVVSLNSEAYSEAQRYITQSSNIGRELGSNIEVQLSPFGYQLEFAGNSGEASFDCAVKGSNANGTVQISLDKVGKAWQVKRAVLNINGKNIAL